MLAASKLEQYVNVWTFKRQNSESCHIMFVSGTGLWCLKWKTTKGRNWSNKKCRFLRLKSFLATDKKKSLWNIQFNSSLRASTHIPMAGFMFNDYVTIAGRHGFAYLTETNMSAAVQAVVFRPSVSLVQLGTWCGATQPVIMSLWHTHTNTHTHV